MFCAVAFFATAQNIISVNGEYTYYAPSIMTLEEAKEEAARQTRIQVLAAKFGTMINSTSTLILENKDRGDKVYSRSDVSTYSLHEVKGEWLEDTKAPVQKISYDDSMPNTTIIHTKVWGRAREIVAKAEVEVSLLKDTLKQAVTDVFKNEQSFYLYFKSPVSGHIAVYLLDPDEDMAYCLLPAEGDDKGSFPVNADKEYILFKEDPSYMFTTERSVVYNHISIIFSPNEFFKPNDERQEDEYYQLPRALQIKEFEKWLVRCKVRDNQLVDSRITVKIVK